MKAVFLSQFKKNQLLQAMGCLLAASAVNVHAKESSDEAAEDVEKISVVGSRIRTGGFDEARPVDIILSSSAINQAISNVGALLRNATSVSGSAQVTSASSTATDQAGGQGAQTLSLRGLGANRTLVLLNGRRAGPAGTRGEVSAFDFNVLPLSVVDRVEILKDGASSIYGSDAVAGVINIITKKLDGGNIETSYSKPEEAGGEEFSINATYGKSFDRGSFMISADYHKSSELQRGQRDYFNCAEEYYFDTDSGERADLIDPRTGNYACNESAWGHVWVYDQQENSNIPGTGRPTLFQYDYDNELANYIPGISVDPNNPENLTTPEGWFPVNYDRNSASVTNKSHPFVGQSSLIPQTTRSTVYAQADYEITDEASLYAEVLLNRRELESNATRQYWSYVYNEDSNGEFPTNPLSEDWSGKNYLSPLGLTDKADKKNQVDYTRWVVGITGDISNTSWYYDVSYQSSRSDGRYGGDALYSDSVTDQYRLSGSCAGTTSSVRGVPCVDIPWLDPQFLAGNISEEVSDYMFGWEEGNTLYTQQSLEAFISGDLFELPAGYAAAVFGASYRKDEINDVPSQAAQNKNLLNATTAGITAGKDNTSSLYTEFRIPLLRDIPLFNALDLDLSARYTDVDSYGDDTTFKVSVNWKISKEWRLRTSRGTSFRSPALYELYLSDQKSVFGQRNIDPCINWGEKIATGASQNLAANCAADGIAADFIGAASPATIYSGGGDGVLKAETSISKNIGLIWSPSFTDLNVSVDYFSIDIANEVTKLSAEAIVNRCYESVSFSTDKLCDLFERDTQTQGISEVRNSFINIATQTNRGYDFALNYNIDTRWGILSFDTQHTIQVESARALFADEVEDTNGQFGDPKHVASYDVTLKQKDWSLNWHINYIGAVSNLAAYIEKEGKDTATSRGVEYDIVAGSDSVLYHSFSFAYQLKEYNTKVLFGLANAFDKKPPQVTTLNLGEYSNQGKSAFYSQYDWRGRRAFVNISYDF